jgi:hypothetical protein
MIIGLNGLIGSGKGAASEYLQAKHNFQHLSFADSLKHAVGAIFGWPFEMLKGATSESRAWREVEDKWWSERLQIPNLTPRWILQQWGTEVGRRSFHPDIWVASLENKIINSTSDIVIDDCRFINEMDIIRKNGGSLIRINRGKLPVWYNDALMELSHSEEYRNDSRYISLMETKYPDVHISEWGWVNQPFDYEVDNNGTLEELHQKLDEIIEMEATRSFPL